jgi:response regulator NasT
MKRPLRIAIADDEIDMRDYLARILPRLGHEVVSAAANGKELVVHCQQLHPDLVITDIRMPEMDGIDAAIVICREQPIPIILISAFHDPNLIARAEQDHVLAYLVKPIKQADLDTAIALATRRFEQFQALRAEADDLRQALENRKLIERAKGILMKKAGLSEQDAFRRLQNAASKRNKKLNEVAQSVILSAELMEEAVDDPQVV